MEDRLFEGDEAVLHVIERIVDPLGLRVDGSSPCVDARLSDGSRVQSESRRIPFNARHARAVERTARRGRGHHRRTIDALTEACFDTASCQRPGMARLYFMRCNRSLDNDQLRWCSAKKPPVSSVNATVLICIASSAASGR